MNEVFTELAELVGHALAKRWLGSRSPRRVDDRALVDNRGTKKPSAERKKHDHISRTSAKQ